MKRNFFSLLICLTVLSSTMVAQGKQESKYKFNYEIDSKAFKGKREFTVYLPSDYYDYPNDSFTVTYVLDGHHAPFIDMVASVIAYGSYNYKYTPTIVVGIHQINRGWEFTMPLEGEEVDYEGGMAPELIEHLESEVRPIVDSIYSRRKNFNSIIGHSAGGEFVLSALFAKPDLFDAYIAISPALRPGEHHVFEDAIHYFSENKTLNKFLYCSSGTVAEREILFGKGIRKLDSIIGERPNNGLIWKKNKFEGMGHWTCVAPSVSDAMVELTRAFRVDEKTIFDMASNPDLELTDQIKQFYESRKSQYDFIEIPQAGYLSRAAIEVYEVLGFPEKSIALFDWSIEQYPNNYTLRKHKAWILLDEGKLKESRLAYNDAFTALEGVKKKIGDETYQNQLAYLKRKLEKLEALDK